MKAHSTAIIEDGAEVGDAVIGPFCHISANVKIHDGVVLESHVVIQGPSEIGRGTHIYPYAVMGGPPQHLGYKGEDTRLIVGANNVIREHVTMHRGTVDGGGVTRVGDNGYFMAGAHVAHDCQVGDKVIFANGAGIGGHVHIGDVAFLGAYCAIHQHCRVGDHAFIGGCAAVTCDIIPYASAVGNHAHLAGLNVVGLKRRGFSRQTIHDLRSAYKLLFFGDGVFKDRINQARREYGRSEEVSRILAFIEAGASRPLMMAARDS
ncbi:acyl-ACP--UDP-N-acetylglucosamine O-acyltransferase [Hyphococcus sp.]|uniref:acyl-ACP--UDP-N-acetylglucosamine O-acyltransferase n=1 Tax=Hyphococcus sp. TaxID=2038636 RepID=UPI002083D2A9|nr:MAG: acyl-[acyl-carrier-protein]--UDP-N-acetylglucosam ine O-acyltransferase [Marinicaulis sp.]